MLAEINERHPSDMLGAKVSEVLARSEARSFHRLQQNELKQSHRSDPRRRSGSQNPLPSDWGLRRTNTLT